MDYVSIAKNLPEELQFPILQLVEAVEGNLREQLAVRREDVDALRSAILELTQAQQRTEQRLTELVEAQQRTEQRVGRLEVAMVALAEAQQHTEQRVGRLEVAMVALAEAQQHTETVVAQLAAQQARMQITLDKHTGYFLEGSYRARPYSYLGRVLRRARTVTFEEMEDTLERHLTEDEVGELTRVDVIVRGRPKAHPAGSEVWLAIEVSATVDRYDVERAQRRAAILGRAGVQRHTRGSGRSRHQRR